MYETLTGRPPYEGETTQAILKLIQAEPPRPILELNPGASPTLVAIAQGAMARELRCRYSQRADVLLDLDRVANELDGADWVWATHLETSTGMVNDIAGLIEGRTTVVSQHCEVGKARQHVDFGQRKCSLADAFGVASDFCPQLRE